MLDLTTGQVLFSQAANTGRLPASVEKLYTTSTALLRLGPNATFTTSILGTGSRDPDGVWDGTLYLRGGGDPTFGSVGFDQSWYGTGDDDAHADRRLCSGPPASPRWTAGSSATSRTGTRVRGTPATGFGRSTATSRAS